MNLTNLTKIALKALNNNKLRCTMLGIIIGVASVITMWPSDKVRTKHTRTNLRNGFKHDHDTPGNMEREV